jgi:hypothetical protein
MYLSFIYKENLAENRCCCCYMKWLVFDLVSVSTSKARRRKGASDCLQGTFLYHKLKTDNILILFRYTSSVSSSSEANYTEQTPSMKADSCSYGQKKPDLLWNRRVHHRIHNIPPMPHSLSISTEATNRMTSGHSRRVTSFREQP